MAGENRTGAPTASLPTPSWLDASLVQETLRRADGDSAQRVKGLTVSAATAPGDNYGSVLYRTKAELVDGSERSVIFKVMHPVPHMAEAIREAGLFQREMVMYSDVLPAMQAILTAAAPDQCPPLAPRGLHVGLEPVEFLALEDLAPHGFKMADRRKGLGLRHCLLALRTLGRFHAASLGLLEKDPAKAAPLTNPFRGQAFAAFSAAGMQGTADACATWPGFEEYVGILDALQGKFMRKMAELHETKSGSFNVILHGDFWLTNMLFHYEDQEPDAHRMVDLQLCHVGPAVLDLLYFLSTSPSEDVSIHHEDLLVREYHKALSDTMELLGLEPPTLETILADMNSHGVTSLYGLLSVLPLVKATRALDLPAVLAGDKSAVAYLYGDPAVKRWLQRLLPEYKRKGWLTEC